MIRVNTNGSLITSDVIELSKSHRVAVGISLDGGTADMNQCRKLRNGMPAFGLIIDGLDRLRDAQVPFSLAIVLSADVLDRGRELLDSIIGLNVQRVGFNPLVSRDPLDDDYGDKVAAFLLEADKVLGPRGILEERFFLKQRLFSHSRIARYDCCANGGNQLSISPGGRVGVCHGLVGSHRDFVTDIFDDEFDPGTHHAFTKWLEYSPFLMSDCAACESLGTCGGGCPLRAYYGNQEWGRADAQFCPSARKIQECLVWKLFDSMGVADAGNSGDTVAD